MPQLITPADPLTPFEQWLTDKERAALTRTAYLKDLRGFAEWFATRNGEPLTPAALTPTDGREYRQYLQKVKAAPATINRKLAALRAYAAWAVEAGHLPENVMDKVRGVAAQASVPKSLDKRAEAALVREVELQVNAATQKSEAAQRQAIRNYALVLFLLNTGLRVAEVCALELDDVELTERKGVVTVRQGKGDKMRAVPLNKPAREALTRWLAARGEADSPRVFLGKRGPLDTSGVQRLMAELSQRTGLANLTPHTLRHTFGKRLVDSGVTLEKIADLMGHENIETTRLYVLPTAQDLALAVAAVED